MKASESHHLKEHPVPRPIRQTLESIIEIRTTRRQAMQGIVAAGGAMTAFWCLPSEPVAQASSVDTEPLGFASLPHVSKDAVNGEASTIGVADGFETQVLLAWGDPLFADVEPMDFHNPSPEDQAKQFGYNNDFVAFMPLPRGSENSRHGLLCVNNEYTISELMFSGITKANKFDSLTDNQIQVERAAHGHSIAEIVQDDQGHWRVITDSHFNRRITVDTEVLLSGPAAGHERLKTEEDPTGRKVSGTLNNCSGGMTPWGTVLSGEENFHDYFKGELKEHRESENYARYGVKGNVDYALHRLDQRFNLENTPNEPNRFGWVVEIDPYQPESTPIKRTALGRMKHEGAATAISHDGRVVVYMGDDETFEYFYKFVTNGKFDPKNPRASKNLLDEGTLYVAKFNPDGFLDWLPLIHGQGPLTSTNGFTSQADVLIETRRAADLMGATPMDRPEDVEENPVTQNVFLALTNNVKRSDEQVSPANPRPDNQHGHIIELTIPKVGEKADHTAISHPWDIFLLAGHLEEDGGWYQGHQPETWVSCPDNLTFDNEGRLWIATDGFETKSGILDGAYVCEVAGPRRALTKQFFHVPTGAELCGPCFTPDNSTLFVAVQHPGGNSTFDQPSTRWPNSPESDLPPRPAVVAITRKGGGPIGG